MIKKCFKFLSLLLVVLGLSISPSRGIGVVVGGGDDDDDDHDPSIRTSRLRGGSVSRRLLPLPVHDDKNDRRPRELVYLGTPTGGDKYPFLVITKWEKGDWRTKPWEHPLCHGVMVTSDVVLTMSCEPDHHVMVGDYSLSNAQSVQYRNIVYRESNGKKTANAIVTGIFVLTKVEPVTLPGFSPVRLNADPNIPRPKTNVTVVGYGLNGSYYGEGTYPQQALETILRVLDEEWCSDVFDLDNICFDKGAGPCRDESGAPLLVDGGTLVGMVHWGGCFDLWSDTRRISYYAELIRSAVCWLTDDSTFACPDLLCPLRTKVFAYPLAKLPKANMTAVKTFNGFVPVSIRQTPRTGTSLPLGSVTNITVSAVDSSNRTASCNWEVVVPGLDDLDELATSYRYFRGGTYLARAPFEYNTGSLSTSIGYELRCELERNLRGGATLTGMVQKGNYTYPGSRFALQRNQSKVTVRNLRVRYSSELRLRLSVRNNKDKSRNSIDCYLYGLW